jgi:secreted Zn-dependent insulinase-like peptidase
VVLKLPTVVVRGCTCFFLALLLTACGDGIKSSERGNEVIKSPNDDRAYRSLELANGLKVLLISDPQTDKSAAALDVGVGSAQDPADREGLAHFLEHMLFLGTDKFPEPEAYQAYISAHSGSHNAYTAFENTNYFFDIEPQYLAGGLDRFSRFFVAPLFTEAYVDREKNAVYSEYKSKLKNEYRRSLDALRQEVNPAHPMVKFSVGNLQTLADRDGDKVRDDLLAFYAKHYSAEVMSLVVLGRESLPELEQMVRSRFSDVPGPEVASNNISEPLFVAGKLPGFMQVRSLKDVRSLSLAFPIPSQRQYYRSKPALFVGDMLGHEGKGSLLEYLKQQGLAEGLSAGAGLDYNGGGLFNISVSLTAKGEANWSQVVEAVFQAVNRFKQHGMDEQMFAQQRQLMDIRFRYQEKAAAIHTVSGLAAQLKKYPAAEVLAAPYTLDLYKPELVEQLLSYISPANAMITLTSRTVDTDKVTELYHTDYSYQPASGWSQVGLNSLIQMPAVNAFIAEDFTLLNDKAEPQLPTLIADNQRYKLWYGADQDFRIPKGEVRATIRSDDAQRSADHAAKLLMLAALADDSLNSFSYPAMLAGLEFDVSATTRGLSLKVAGYTDKQPLLLTALLDGLQQPTYSQTRFNNIKDEFKRGWQNADYQPPYGRLVTALNESLMLHYWSEQQLLASLEAIDLDEVLAYRQQFFAQAAMEMLVYGNYSEQQAIDFADLTAQALALGGGNTGNNSVVELPAQQNWSRTVAVNHNDAAGLLYVQGRSDDYSERALMGVTAQLLKAPFYSSLRTEQQLGYIVYGVPKVTLKVPGLMLLVQSPTATPETIQAAMLSFIAGFAEQVQAEGEEAFIRQRQALVAAVDKEPENLSQQSGIYWRQIALGYQQFDMRDELIGHIEAVEYQQWLSFYQQRFVEQLDRSLWLQTTSPAFASPLQAKPMGSVVSFKGQQQYYRYK